METQKKYVYSFGGEQTEGNKDMRDLLGGKGANLAEMSSIGIPVPAGFTITTEVCNIYTHENGRYPEEVKTQVAAALKKVENIMGSIFGDKNNPLLVSVRSGARQSMPGMMETVLNVGLTSATIPAMIEKTKNERFVYDSYRRLMMMYSDVVMEKAAGIEPEEGKGIRLQLEEIMDALKKEKNYKLDTDMNVEDLKYLTTAFKSKIKEVIGKEFPDTAEEQLWGAIGAVFQSWNGKRAVAYRNIEGIPEDWGTAVNVQSMVFGNMGENSATGVAFSRNPATGENAFFGEWLINAQGEDVVAGIRTPYALNEACKLESNKNLPSLEVRMPELYKQFCDIRTKLEQHYKDMQDLEFTIQEGKLWMLQTRSGKRNGPAALQMALDMVKEGLIDKRTAITRVKPSQLDELLHPMVDPVFEKDAKPLCKGLPAGPGGATGKIVLTPAKADELTKKGEKIILVRNETSPEDVQGMHIAEAILTAKGGMTSHAALVARGWGKCCIVGCGVLDINIEEGTVRVGDTVLHEEDIITLNGTKGNVYIGTLPLKVIDPEENEELKTFLGWCDEVRSLMIRTNADNPKDAAQARRFGAQGIGLCRTEHMFFGDERIIAIRKMIMAHTAEERALAINALLKYQKADFLGIFKAMEGLPVTVRLLDPPLHEFVPQTEELLIDFAKKVGRPVEEVRAKVEELHELNPMLGHRGVRLGIVFAEITRMQARAILEAVAELTKQGIEVHPEIMIPLVGHIKELRHQKAIILDVAEQVKKEYGLEKLDFMIGTMIEVPRAALTANEIATEAEFFSFGTNDLTQMTCGFSRDDASKFLPTYVRMKIYNQDPFQSIDQEGVGQLIKMGIEKGRSVRENLKVGICGEHGGDPDSIDFCHRVGMNYVSCSPFRVPIARLAAAHAEIRNPRKK
jgi:pyruvate,orthophosphate dikinase